MLLFVLNEEESPSENAAFSRASFVNHFRGGLLSSFVNTNDTCESCETTHHSLLIFINLYSSLFFLILHYRHVLILHLHPSPSSFLIHSSSFSLLLSPPSSIHPLHPPLPLLSLSLPSSFIVMSGKGCATWTLS